MAALPPISAENERKSSRTRRRLLDAAARLFKERGYAGTRQEDIADAAAIKAASVYYHFSSKEELMGEVLDQGIARCFDAVTASVDALGPEASLRARLRAAVAAHLDMLLRHGDYTAANIRSFGQVPEPIRRRHWPLREAYGDYWRGLLESGQRSGELKKDADLSLLRMLLLGSLNWAIEWYDPRRKTADEIAATVVEMFLDGVAGDANSADAESGKIVSLEGVRRR